ncbi:MAG: hypothetical protein M3P37_08980 [Actinomycetota bacterium]|nr:hypothetical protein [Actinomycetota bacterium]
MHEAAQAPRDMHRVAAAQPVRPEHGEHRPGSLPLGFPQLRVLRLQAPGGPDRGGVEPRALLYEGAVCFAKGHHRLVRRPSDSGSLEPGAQLAGSEERQFAPQTLEPRDVVV